MKKIIGLTGWSTGENSFGVTKPYLEYFSHFGQVEILTPQKGIREDIDLLILPGGKDTNTSNYGQVPGFMNSDPDLFKEYFFKQNLPQYIEAKTPIFGICLGMQQLNVHFGGSLTQHLMYHGFYSSRSRDELVHEVYPVTNFKDGKWIFSKQKNDVFKVNSMHHQGIYLDQLADDLSPLLFSEGTNERSQYLVEAFRHNTLPIAGYQGHPEESYCDFATKMINELLNVNKKKLV